MKSLIAKRLAINGLIKRIEMINAFVSLCRKTQPRNRAKSKGEKRKMNYNRERMERKNERLLIITSLATATLITLTSALIIGIGI